MNSSQETTYPASPDADQIILTWCDEPASEKYNEVYVNKGRLFQIIHIDGNALHFIFKYIDGMITDQFQLKKSNIKEI